jgi:hypothetical protein
MNRIAKTAAELEELIRATDKLLINARFHVHMDESSNGWTATSIGKNAEEIEPVLKKTASVLGMSYALKK